MASTTDEYRGIPTEIRLNIWQFTIPVETKVVSVVEVKELKDGETDATTSPYVKASPYQKVVNTSGDAKASDNDKKVVNDETDENKSKNSEVNAHLTKVLDAEPGQVQLDVTPIEITEETTRNKHIWLKYPFPVPKYKAVLDPPFCLSLLQANKQIQSEFAPYLKSCTTWDVTKLEKEDAKLFWRGLTAVARKMTTALKIASAGPEANTWIYYLLKFDHVPHLIITVSGKTWRESYKHGYGRPSDPVDGPFTTEDIENAFRSSIWNDGNDILELLIRGNIGHTFEVRVEGADDAQREYLEARDYRGWTSSVYDKVGVEVKSVPSKPLEDDEGKVIDLMEDMFDVSILATKTFQTAEEKEICRSCGQKHEKAGGSAVEGDAAH